MNIAMIGLRGLDDGLGGVETVVREISTRLAATGESVTCYGRSRYVNSPDAYAPVQLIGLPTIYTKHLETAAYAATAITHCIKKRYDIVHIHALATATLAWLPKLLSRSKIIVTIHALDWQREKWGPAAKRILQTGEKTAIRYAHAVTCVSENLRNSLQNTYPATPIHYIPNGCEQSAEPAPPPAGHAAGDYLLFMARLVPEKGAHLLIDAFSNLSTNKKLVIAGPELHDVAYVRQIRHAATQDSRIQFVGPLTGRLKQQYLQHAFAFVLPSTTEGLPLSLLDAQAAGVPAVISDLPTLSELAGPPKAPHCIRCEPNSARSLHDAMRYALDHPGQLARQIVRAQAYVQQKYDWNRIATQYHDLYRQVLEK